MNFQQVQSIVNCLNPFPNSHPPPCLGTNDLVSVVVCVPGEVTKCINKHDDENCTYNTHNTQAKREVRKEDRSRAVVHLFLCFAFD